jgi:hypothetical protein
LTFAVLLLLFQQVEQSKSALDDLKARLNALQDEVDTSTTDGNSSGTQDNRGSGGSTSNLNGGVATEGDDAVGSDAETTTADGAGVDREDDDVGVDSDVTMAEERVAAAKALAAAELSAAVKAKRDAEVSKLCTPPPPPFYLPIRILRTADA